MIDQIPTETAELFAYPIDWKAVDTVRSPIINHLLLPSSLRCGELKSFLLSAFHFFHVT